MTRPVTAVFRAADPMAEMLSRIRKGNVQLKKVEQEKPKPGGEQGIMQEMASILVGGEGVEEGRGGEGRERGWRKGEGVKEGRGGKGRERGEGRERGWRKGEGVEEGRGVKEGRGGEGRERG